MTTSSGLAMIAAFARFNLQLLSLGAPASLVQACNAAIADETEHALMCFGLASTFAGAPLGPGRLDANQCLQATSLVEVAKLVLFEGCFGETTAALEACEAASLATDPMIKSTLLRIAADEQRHAELAFRFLAWALTGATAAERAEIEGAAAAHLEQQLRGELSASHDAEASALPSHGLMSARELSKLRLHAMRNAVEPLLAALFAQFPIRAGETEAPSRLQA